MIRKALVLVLIALSPQVLAEESYYDGKNTLLCSVLNTRQCDINGCQLVAIEDINLPRHILADFKKKRLSSTQFYETLVETRIHNVTRLDNLLFVSGVDESSKQAEDALAWSMAIAEPTGLMTLTINGDETAFVAFGVCVPVD